MAGHIEKLNPVEFPELVELARDLMGQAPEVVKTTGKALGRFIGEEGGRIKLVADLFKKGKEVQLARVLAHELGHLVDYLPDQTLKRGNMLGHLLTLRKFLKHTFGESTVKAAELKAELKALSEYWRPFPDNATASYEEYRDRNSELYADFISALFSSPGIVEQKAPKAYNLFFETLDQKSEVRAGYFELQALLAGDRAALIAHRRKGVRAMFDDGDYKSKELQERRIREAKERRNNFWFQFKSQLVTRFAGVQEKVNELEKKGTHVNPDDNPVFYLRESNYLGGKIKAFVETNIQNIYKELADNQVGWTDFGEILFYERIIAGDRSEVANPRGITPQAAEELYKTLLAQFTEAQQSLIKKNAELFRGAIRKVSDEAYAEGLYKEELYKQMLENPNYVSFRVIEHLEASVTSKVYRQLGTLKDITNPADASILKMIATLRAIERNKVTKKVADFLKQNFKDEIKDAKKIFTGKTQVPVESRLPNETLITYYEKGNLQGYYVDPYISMSLERSTAAQNNLVVNFMKFFNGGLFRPLFITFNLGFQSFNLMRDFIRFWKNIPGLGVFRAIKRYGQAFRPAKARAFGLGKNATETDKEAQKLIQTLEQDQIFSVTFNDLIRGQEIEDKQIDEILKRSGISTFAPQKRTPLLLRPVKMLLDFIERTGNLIETLPKVAGYFELKGKMPAREMRDFIRRKVGSPDFLDKGVITPTTNEVFLFSNAIIQGIRSDVEIATDPKTRSGFWWKTAFITLVPKSLMFAAIIGLFGDAYREMMMDVSEYDKTNYTIIPLGKDDNNKTIYVRLPADETTRLIGGILWKILRAGGNKTPWYEDIANIASFSAGQLPNVSPVITTGFSTVQFLAGQNPYDFFRNRNVLSEQEFKAGGTDAAKPFAGWLFQQLGGGVFVKFYTGEQTPKEKSTAEKIVGLPIISNIVGRFVRVSDVGVRETLREEIKPIEKEQAKRQLQETRLVNDYVARFQKEGGGDQAIKSFTRELVIELLGHEPKTDDEIDKARRVAKKFRVSIQRGKSDPRIDALIVANTNEEKFQLLKSLKSSLSEEEFRELSETLLREKIVSVFLMGKLRKESK